MKNEEKRKTEIATFRFGVIADLVTGVVYTRGEKEKILKAKSQRKYEVPYSERSRVSRETILKWVRDYERGGRCLDALFPKARSDKGTYKSLEPAIRLTIKELIKETPRITVPAVIRRLRHDKVLPVGDNLCPATLYRYLKHEKLRMPNEEADDRRQFEAEYPNQIWQSDVMHGPYVTVGKRKKKTYLIAFLDDHSRFILHAAFYLNEQLETFRKALQQAVIKHGLCQKLYVDNGSCFRGVQLEHTAAQLGIAISHSRPYIPQGRGKIERWFLSVRQQFLLGLKLPDDMDLPWLNDQFESWLDSYQRTDHKGINQTPRERYFANLKCLRPAPNNLSDFFRSVETRLVKKDRSFRLKGRIYEAPVALIDRTIEVRFPEEDPSKVEIFFEGMSFGMATLLDPHLNAKLGRRWMTHEKNKPEISQESASKMNSVADLPPRTGALPLNQEVSYE